MSPDEVFHTHKGLAMAIARNIQRRCEHADIDDLRQEALMALWKYVTSEPWERGFAIRRIVRDVYRYVNRHSRMFGTARAMSTAVWEDRVLEDMSFDDTTARLIDMRDTYHHLLGVLTPLQKETVEAVMLHAHDRAEVAKIFGIPHATVSTRMFKAMHRMKDVLVRDMGLNFYDFMVA
jgi:RNA polymerase sigma factor (sigma-70 family)